MSCLENLDLRLIELNRRARLMDDAADELLLKVPHSVHEQALRSEALAVADEAAALVFEYGAEPGLCFYHGDPSVGEDPEQLHEGWAISARCASGEQP
jgi:hypothetical protein